MIIAMEEVNAIIMVILVITKSKSNAKKSPMKVVITLKFQEMYLTPNATMSKFPSIPECQKKNATMLRCPSTPKYLTKKCHYVKVPKCHKVPEKKCHTSSYKPRKTYGSSHSSHSSHHGSVYRG